jgi:acyl-homoserine-lactone acylase
LLVYIIARMRVGEHDLPASGDSGLETFRVFTVKPALDGRLQVTHGDSFIFAVEFSEPVRAEMLTLCGNATQPASPHVGDQLELYLADEKRPAWRSREEIEANLRLLEEVSP